MTVLPKRRIGKTKVEVTTLGLGGAPMGGFRATISDTEAMAIVDEAWAGGVRYYDTSPFYGYGRSELRFGAGLREKPRDEFILSTKIGRILQPLRPGEQKPADFRENGLPGFSPVFDYTYDGVMRSLEHSHLRLGLAKIDIALIHDVDFWTIKDREVLNHRFKTVMDSGFKALDELRKAGVIGAIGVGINESDTSLRFIQAGDFDCMLLAGRYTLLEQGGLEEFLPECVKRNVSVILGGPYNSGILTGGVKPGATHDYVPAAQPLIDKAMKIEAVCKRHGVE
ncbi:MAG TPA: aldo/keto reductase, partial [Reyranella sp.]|nr:aldo/keto reductase [Reyranella sp.]